MCLHCVRSVLFYSTMFSIELLLQIFSRLLTYRDLRFPAFVIMSTHSIICQVLSHTVLFHVLSDVVYPYFLRPPLLLFPCTCIASMFDATSCLHTLPQPYQYSLYEECWNWSHHYISPADVPIRDVIHLKFASHFSTLISMVLHL